jgi:hypothetical protein
MARVGRKEVVFTSKQAKDIIKKYVKEKIAVIPLSKEFGCSAMTIHKFLDKQGLIRKKLQPFTAEQIKLIKKYYLIKGWGYERIALKFNLPQEKTRLLIKSNGWTKSIKDCREKFIKKQRLETAKKHLNHPIRSYAEYRYVAHRILATVWPEISSEVDPTGKRLRYSGYVVDHKYSVYSGFNRSKPLPMEILSHPCNLRVISAKKNGIKGKSNSISLKTLKQKVQEYNLKYGMPRCLKK